jgi:hypothetical protein
MAKRQGTRVRRRGKIKKFFSKLVDNIIVALFIAGFLVVLASPGWLPALTDFLPKHYPQYSNYWLIAMGVIGGIGVIVVLMLRTATKAQEKDRYEHDVMPIIEDADLKSHTDKQKEEIKSILKELNSEITSAALHKVLETLQDKHKNHFKLALPYIKRYINQFLESYS